MRKTRAVAVLTATGLVAGLSGVATGPVQAATRAATSAKPHKPGPLVEKLATGLQDPWGIQWTGTKRFVVAENAAGRVTEVGRHGFKKVRMTGLAGVAGVAAGDNLYAVLGGPPPPDEQAGAAGKSLASRGPAVQRVGAAFAPTSVVRARRDGSRATAIKSLEAYELAHNPDGQVQFNPDPPYNPYDALSNPFSMNLSRYGLLVADGGANDVLKVNPRTGRVSTFFVPPTVTDVPFCTTPEAQANPGTVGCDSVPTGIAVARGAVYVSTLGAEVPGAGRVYRLNPRTGAVLRTWKGLTAPTGIAVTERGTIFVSEVLYGFPEQGPGPGFDPSTVGRITRISPNGRRTHAKVTMPLGLSWHSRHLYSTAWSLGSMVGKTGQVVWVKQRAFR